MQSAQVRKRGADHAIIRTVPCQDGQSRQLERSGDQGRDRADARRARVVAVHRWRQGCTEHQHRTYSAKEHLVGELERCGSARAGGRIAISVPGIAPGTRRCDPAMTPLFRPEALDGQVRVIVSLRQLEFER